ncbi:hypothetical protein OHS33_31595 [Streptomyces sp. NBC_00536]|uniref:hypothetical protein n=1 Tax=Streptomyces sp. NBC_00536 TaxID=2975769 RepID=UPI002E801064|nr:hypothetical protein [Streptomyces sp. NBC_00536]WUC82502.1 hypothetical protein OHS33_31595 [Streptomyces sp. NBC_00536]
MGAIRTSVTALLVAGAAGTVLALGASCAVAAGAQPVTSFGFAVAPSTVAPGGSVVLSVTGCTAASTTVSSGIFDTVSVPKGKTVRVTVDRDARRGARYSVNFTCNNETGSTDLTIAGGTSTPTTRSTAASRGVRGGLGGSVAGMDTGELAAGAGLLLAAAAGTGYAVRRRTNARGH